MEKIKIVHVSETMVSGVYTYINQLCKYLDKTEKFKTYIIYSNERSETDDAQIKNDFSDQTELIQVNMTREISFFKDLRSLVKLIIVLRKIKPDIIHVHSSKAGVLGRIAHAFCFKSKLYYTPHGYSFIREDISPLRKKLYRFIEVLITKIFGGKVIACGDHEYNEAKSIGEAILIRNGFNFNNVSNYASSVQNKVLTIGTSGKIYNPKNPKQFDKIAMKLPQYDFLWIGDGEEFLRKQITAPNVQITGWKRRDEALKQVKELDIFISTSSWEGLPFNIIEAMALSKPIVTSDIEGNRITVRDGYNGFICKSTEDYIEAIKKLQDPEVRKKLGDNSFQMAHEMFNSDKNMQQLITVYLEGK
ncbi:MAG: glycosyltransferase [Bacteroidetes bacterium]|nr:glycosyltransferase [Bacteroidota bacterium]